MKFSWRLCRTQFDLPSSSQYRVGALYRKLCADVLTCHGDEVTNVRSVLLVLVAGECVEFRLSSHLCLEAISVLRYRRAKRRLCFAMLSRESLVNLKETCTSYKFCERGLAFTDRGRPTRRVRVEPAIRLKHDQRCQPGTAQSITTCRFARLLYLIVGENGPIRSSVHTYM